MKGISRGGVLARRERLEAPGTECRDGHLRPSLTPRVGGPACLRSPFVVEHAGKAHTWRVDARDAPPAQGRAVLEYERALFVPVSFRLKGSGPGHVPNFYPLT